MEMPVWVLTWGQHVVFAFFLFLFGACVGSFLNVVAYRLPEGRSIVRPGSRCPTCGWSLSWRENLPILGWIMLLGRCRKCKTHISLQYPLFELLVAIVFAGTYLLLFAVPIQSWWIADGGPWWILSGFGRAWPAYLVLVGLLSGLFVATLIDARTFLIPAPITNAMTTIALVGWFIQGLLPVRPSVEELWPIPMIGGQAVGVAIGAAVGLGISMLLLSRGVIPRSFLDYEDYVDEGETLGDYPHARREMWKEILFLLPALVGGVAGWLAISMFDPDPTIPRWLAAMSASLLGAMVGGGLIWVVRILGTLGFGREAMGMGDVHLLAAVGAALGWVDPIRAFFIAPFTALAWVFISRIVSMFSRKSSRELPYGPHLAMATCVVIFLRPVVENIQSLLLNPVP